MGEERKNGVVNLTPSEQMQLQAENIKLKSQMQQATRLINQLQESLSIKRMDYLFKILEHSDKFSMELLGNVIAEIEETFKPIQQPEEAKEKTDE